MLKALKRKSNEMYDPYDVIALTIVRTLSDIRLATF